MSEELLAEVRKETPSAIWSSGVKLARGGGVSIASRTADTTTLRVRDPAHTISPTVLLYPDDLEWDCDCGSRVSPCAHVAAAAIALAQGEVAAETTGAPESAAGDAGRPAAPLLAMATTAKLAYELSTKHGLLVLARVVVHPDGRRVPLPLPIVDIVARRIADPPLDPSREDIEIDRVMGRKLVGEIPLEKMRVVLEALAHHEGVTYEGRAVKTSGEALRPRATVRDVGSGGGAGVELTIERSPLIEKIAGFKAGLTKSGEIALLGATDVYGPALEKLPLTRTFAHRELGELVGGLLPKLDKHADVVITSKRLPGVAKRAVPRLHFELKMEGPKLHVLPTLVYGDPPLARVDAGKLVLLAKDAPAFARDENKEKDLVLRLRDRLELVVGRLVAFEAGEASRFAAKLQSFRGSSGGDAGDAMESRQLVAKMSATEDGQAELWFELEGDDEGSGGRAKSPARASAASVWNAFAEGLSIVPLEGGGFAPIPRDFLERHGHLVADLVLAREGAEKLPPAAAPMVLELADALGAPRPAALEKLAALAPGGVLPSAPLPIDLRADLRAYQTRGVDWLSFLQSAELGGLLADDMGLGKTLQAIAVLRGRVLVVCPRSVVHNWASEIARFRPSLRVARYEGGGRALDETADVTLTTYGVLRIDREDLAKIRWDAVVLDEAQAIKNPSSQTARAAFGLDAKFRLALSGTPVENRLEELWSLLRFCVPGLLGGRDAFSDRWARPMSRGDAGAAAKLRARIAPFVLRRKKGDVLTELPPRSETTDFVELDETERAAYDAVRAATKKEVVAKLAEGGSILLALEALLRLRQAACHRGLLPNQTAPSSSKVERLVETLEELVAEGHRALVFSQWTSFLDKVEPALDEAGLRFVRLDGSTRDRQDVVERFQAEDGPPVFLLSLKAGGTGLNLTAADHVFLLDPWWNPAVEDQAADRAHRIGQERPVLVHRLVAKGTVEERILALQEKKRAIAEAAIGDASGAAEITRDDLMELLS
jgi:superfamily II DNA or RNA helicase